MSSQIGKYRVSLIVCIVGLIIVAGLIFFSDKETDEVSPVAMQALKYLYQFQVPEELDANMEGLRIISTNEVYNQLTIDTTDRTLRIYLKFKGKPSSVSVISANSKSIWYRLNTEEVSASRVFLFDYEITKGKLSRVREAELVLFPTLGGESDYAW